jgi:hypothetical protein
MAEVRDKPECNPVKTHWNVGFCFYVESFLPRLWWQPAFSDSRLLPQFCRWFRFTTRPRSIASTISVGVRPACLRYREGSGREAFLRRVWGTIPACPAA